MRALAFWKTESLFSLLRQHGIRYCVVGGQAVNSFVEPLVSLDVDLVVAASDIDKDLAAEVTGKTKTDRAAAVGRTIAERAAAKGISR